MATREYSDPDIAPLASQVVGQGIPGQIAPRAPIKPTAPDDGPLKGTSMLGKSIGNATMSSAGSPGAQPSVYIPGASRHELVHVDEGRADTVKDYPVGIGAWQSRSHTGTASSEDNSLRPAGERPRGPDMEGSPDAKYASHPKEAGNGVTSQSNAGNPNSKSYDSPPVHMDYSCDMGYDHSH